jgi:hypothetical protein
MRPGARITRRTLLAGGAGFLGTLAAAGTALGSSMPTAPGAAKSIPRVRLGETGLQVSRVALFSSGSTGPEAVSRFVSAGVNLVTMPATAVATHGEALTNAAAGGELILAPRTAPGGTLAVDLPMVRKALGVATVDLHVHHLATSPRELLDPVVRHAVATWKDAGQLGNFGLFVDAPRRPACLEAAAGSRIVDVIFVPYSFRDRDNEAFDRALDLCAGMGLGIVAVLPKDLQLDVQPQASELAQVVGDPLPAAVRYVLDDQRVHAVAVGSTIGNGLMSAIHAVAHPLSDDQATAIAWYASETRDLVGRSTS